MKFSIQSALIVLALVSVAIAALFSKSAGFVNLVSAAALFLIPMMLVFAICDGRKSRRPFWIGCFIMSATSLVASEYSATLGSVQYQVADLVCTPAKQAPSPVFPLTPYAVGAPQAYPTPPGQIVYPPATPVVSTAGFNQAVFTTPTFGPTQTGNQFIYVSNGFQEHYQAVVMFVPVVFSILFGIAGGAAAVWISKMPDSSKQNVDANEQSIDDSLNR